MYFVIEIQKRTDGEWYETIWHFSELNRAESKFHAILSEASTSDIPVNGAVLFDDKGIYYERKVYEHE